MEARRTPVSLAKIHRLVRTVAKRQEAMEVEIAGLREELRTSETALAAARLRALNERQAREGISVLRADLLALRAQGIVDGNGNRKHRSAAKPVSKRRSDVV